MNDKDKKVPNVPNLRFKEFNEEWKETALEDLTMKTYRAFAGGPFGSNLKSCDYTDKGIPIIQLGNITEDYLNFKDRLIFTSIKKADELIASNAYSGDLIIAKMMPAGRACIASDLYPRYVLGSDGIRVCLDKEKCNIIFIRDQINSEKIKKEISSKTAGSTRQRIGIPELKKLKLLVPCIDEQNKIGALLSLLEKRIEAQNKIIEDLESQITWIKNNLYLSKTGNKYELREVLCERKEYTTKDSSYEHVTLSKEGIIPKSERYDRDFLVTDDEKKYKITKLNDLCYNPANLKFGVICKNNYGDSIFSPIYITYEINKKHDPDYVCMLLTNDNFINYIRRYEQGTVYERMAVNPTDFLKGYVYLPDIAIQKETMKKINTVLEKINIEKSILKKYKEQKNYLLINMFI